MTTDNPFTARIRQAAQEGYVNSTRREPRFESQGYIRNGHAVRLASAKQVALINSLLSERDLAAETRPNFKARLTALATDQREVESLDVTKASNLITYLFGLPQAFGTTHEPAAFAEVPAGHYALERDGEISFYSVDRPIEGRWAGKVFVSLLHGPDQTSMSRQAGNTVLGHIVEQGVLECLTRYGREIGKCGVCHRRLTNEESRRDGIGPICRERV